MEYLPYLWLALIVLAIVVEGVTAQLVSIWFAVGGLVTLIVSLFQVPFSVQLTLYVIFTAVALVVSRPLVKRLHVKRVDTNAGRCIGQIGVVTADINNTLAKGQVQVLGNVWSARSADGSIIPAGNNVKIREIQGVKLIVERAVG